nr:immune inhibitor A domain-containing protein [uncultured Acetatifactor sp.]
MSGFGKKQGRLAGFLAMLLTAAMIVTLPLPFLPHTEAEAVSGRMANLVIFVKKKSDTKDVFNASYTSGTATYSNWKQIKGMYNDGTGYEGNNSFQNYISIVTEGKVAVENYFPQEKPDQTAVATLTLSSDSDDGGVGLVEEVVKAINDKKIILDTANHRLDNQNAGYIDNLTIILQGNTINGKNTAFHTKYAGQAQIKESGLRVLDYNVIPSGMLVSDNGALHVGQEQGVIAHEFLHTLGLPDLYRQNGVGEPVGLWDIMANTSSFLQYPLSYLRARQGWISMGTITQSGTYTLTAVSESGGNKVFVLRTPLSDTEFICLEYRRKSGNINGFEHKIPSDGLLMYRVDTKVDGLTNHAGKNYIYVYRPGVTDPEAGTDLHPDTNLNLSREAALDVAKGEISYGSTDLDADFTKDTLYYSDGSNSGIRLSDLKLSGDRKQLTFTVTFADYKNVISWENMGDAVSSQCIGEEPFICTDPAGGTVYAAFLESMSGNDSYGQVCVKRWDGAAWQQVGTKIGSVSRSCRAVLAVCGGEVYLSYLNGTNQPMYCRLENGAWKQVASHSAVNPKYMQFAVDGSSIYAAYEDSGTWKIYDLKTNKPVDSQLKARDFSHPAMLASDGSFYMVYADFADGVTKIQKYTGGTWSTVNTLPGRYTNIHYIGKYGNRIYAFAGSGSAGVEGGDGQSPIMAVFDGSTWKNYPVSAMTKYNLASMAMAGDQVCLAYYDTSVRKVKLLQGTGDSFGTIADNLGTGVDYLGMCGYGSNLYIAMRAQNSTNLVVRRKVISGGSVTPPGGDGGTDTPVTPPGGDGGTDKPVTPPGGDGGTDKPVTPPGGDGGTDTPVTPPGGDGGTDTPTPPAQEARLVTLTPPAGYADNHVYIDGIEYTASRSGDSYQLKLPDTSGRTAVMYAYDAKNIPVGMYVWRLSWDGEACRAVPMPGLENLLSYHGFSIRVQGQAGIRFKSGIDANLKKRLIAGGVDGCKLKEYGTLFMTNENREKYPFIKDGTKVGGGRAYWTENGKVTDKVFETVGGRNRFTSVLINLAPNMYAKDISFRAYAVVECDGRELILYGPPVYRSVYTVAKQVQAKGEFKPGTSGYRYVQGIIDSVEKK